MKRHFGQKSSFYYEQSRYIMAGRELIMKGQDFHDDRSIFS